MRGGTSGTHPSVKKTLAKVMSGNYRKCIICAATKDPNIRLNTHEVERHRVDLSSDRIKAHYAASANQELFDEGVLVWMYTPQRKKGLSSKLSPP